MFIIIKSFRQSCKHQNPQLVVGSHTVLSISCANTFTFNFSTTLINKIIIKYKIIINN